jgi:GNAT superfamily N-acetyltransferase
MTQDEFTIKLIVADDLDDVSGMCWENRETQLRILEKQEILGIGAWDEKDVCVGQLHCYEVTVPGWDDSVFPDYARNRLEDWPLGWPLLAAKEKELEFDGPVWGHACFHVGVLPDTWHAEPEYFERGIGTAMLEASVAWARDHDYAAIIAHGGPKIIPAYNNMMGCMPWTSYAKLGFETKAFEEDAERLPWWIESKGDEIKSQVDRALEEGHELEDIVARLMVLRLR